MAHVITGNDNEVSHKQEKNTGKEGFIEINGNNNEVSLYQKGQGTQWADILLEGDGHMVESVQRDSGTHNLALDLTNGGGAYDLDTQQANSANQSYSLTGICTNGNGCAVSITQN